MTAKESGAEGYVRKPVDQQVRYDPWDVPADVLALHLNGSETDPTGLEYFGSANDRSIFDYLVEECGPRAKELAAYGFTTISINGVAFPIEVISDRAKLKAWYEKDFEAKHPKRKIENEEIEGDAETVFEGIRSLLHGNLPPGAALEYEETEHSQSQGYFTDEHDEYTGKLTVRMRIVWGGDQDDTVVRLGSTKSTNSYRHSALGVSEPDTYYYRLHPKKVSGWIK